MTFKGMTTSDSDKLGVPVDGIMSIMFNVTGGLSLALGFTGQSCTKYLIPQSMQYLVKGGSPGTAGLPRLGYGQSATQWFPLQLKHGPGGAPCGGPDL